MESESVGAARAPLGERLAGVAPLAAVLALAVALRLNGIAFGLPALLDPDEPIFVLTALGLLKKQTLNPHWFGHPGTTTIYALAIVFVLTLLFHLAAGDVSNAGELAKRIYQDPSVVWVPGRLLMMGFGLLTILLTWLLARRLFGNRVALLSAALLAFDPVHIRYSQIIRTDMHSTVFVLLALLAAVAIYRRGAARDYFWAGLCVGFACATKWPAVACASSVLAAAVAWHLRHPDDVRRTMSCLVIFGAASVLGLFLASPFVFFDFGTVVQNLHGEERPYHLNATGHGLLGNLLWYVRGPLLTGLGLPGLILAVAGFGIAVRRQPAFLVTAGVVAAVFLLMIACQALVWERWAVPILPMVTIAAAVGMDWLATRLKRHASRPVAIAGGLALVGIVSVAPIVTALRQAAERRQDTRLEATRWAQAHVRPGETVAIEHLAFDVLQKPWRFLYPAGDVGCVDVRANLRGQVSYGKIEQWRGGRAVVDLGSVPPALDGTCAADWAILVNWDRYRSDPAHFEDELAAYQRLLARGRIVASFYPKAGAVGGPIVRIVRFDRPPPAH